MAYWAMPTPYEALRSSKLGPELTGELPDRFLPVSPVVWLAQAEEATVDDDLRARISAVRAEIDDINREYAKRLRR